MMKVTQADIVAAEAQAKKHYQTLYDYEMDLRQAFAARAAQARQEALDRLRSPASLEAIARAIGRETVARHDRGLLFDDLPAEDKATVLEMLDAALADALQEQKP